MSTGKHPVTEQISLDRAIELLGLHKSKNISANVVATVVRDPQNLNHIVSFSVSERDVVIHPAREA